MARAQTQRFRAALPVLSPTRRTPRLVLTTSLSPQAGTTPSPLNFPETNLPGPATKIVLSGSTANLTAGATRLITATIEDANGNTVTTGSDSSLSVTFGQSSGSGTVTGLTAVTASEASRPTRSPAASPDPSRSVHPLRPQAGAISQVVLVSFTVVAGTASTIAISSGDSQTANVSTAFASPLVALVTDAGGNPISGTTVTFTAPGSGASGTFRASSGTCGLASARGQRGGNVPQPLRFRAALPVLSPTRQTPRLVLTTSLSPLAGRRRARSTSPRPILGPPPSSRYTVQPSSGQNIQATGTGSFNVTVAVEDRPATSRPARIPEP